MTRHFRASLRYLPDIDGYYPRFQAILIYVFAREIRISLFYSPPFGTESSNLFPFCILHRHQKNFIRLGLLTYFDWIKFKKKKNIKIDNIYTLLPSWKNEKLINKGWRIGARIKNRSHRFTLEEMTWKVCESISTSYVRSTDYLSPPVELSRLFPQMMEFIRRDTTTIHSCIVHRYLLRWELPRALVHAYA